MSVASHNDAIIVIQLSQWGATADLQEANEFLWSKNFTSDYDEFLEKYPWGSTEHGYASSICSWYETLGALHKHGLINQQLIFDWLAVDSVWNRIRGFALGIRKEHRDPRLYSNFESLAELQSKSQ